MNDHTYQNVGGRTWSSPVGFRLGSRIVWRLVLVSSLVLVVSAAAYPLLPRKYSATVELLLRPTNQEGATTWDQSIRDALDDSAIQTKIDLLHSEALQLSVINKNNLVADPEFNRTLNPSRLRLMADSVPWLNLWLPEGHTAEMQMKMTLLKSLIVKRGKSYLMKVGYESNDPVKAAALANSLANEFRVDQLNRKRASLDDLLVSMRERVARLEAEYHANEQREEEFITTSGLAHRGEKESMDRQLVSLSAELAEARRRTIEATSRAAMLASQRAGGVDDTSEALASPLLQNLRRRYVELISGIGSGNVAIAGSGNVPAGVAQPGLVFLRQAIDTETARLVRSAQNEASVAQQNEIALHSELLAIDLKLIKWQANERQRVDLHRAVTTSLDSLQEANRRLEQQAGRGDVLQPDVEIVSSAEVSDRPSFPDPLLYILGTFAMVGVFCGLVLLPVTRERIRAR